MTPILKEIERGEGMDVNDLLYLINVIYSFKFLLKQILVNGLTSLTKKLSLSTSFSLKTREID